MPNPDDNCSDCTEWIEIYNPQNLTLNLSEWKIRDNSKTNNITCYNNKNCSLIVNSTYFIIVGMGANISQITNESIVYFYTDNKKIGNGLNNNYETIEFYNLSYSTNFTYNGSEKGKSWARLPDGENWTICRTPTPGKKNKCQLQQYAKLMIYLYDVITLNTTYNKLFKIEIKNKENCSAKDNVTVSYLIKKLDKIIKEDNFTREIGCSAYANTGQWIPKNNGNFTICGRIINATTNFTNEMVCKNITVIDFKTIPCNLVAKISLQNSSQIIFSDEIVYNISVYDFNYSNLTHPIEIKYWIEEFYSGNSIYSYSHVYTADKNPYVLKDRKKKIDGCGVKIYLIKANISNSHCNDTNLSDNYDEKFIAVVSNEKCELEVVEKVIYRTVYVGKEEKENKDIKIEILNLTKNVRVGERFKTKIRIKNLKGMKIKLDVYSYAYSGKRCITGSWTENKKEITLEKNEEKIIVLENKIENNTEEGEYTFKVRAKLGNRNIDIKNKILVKGKIEIKKHNLTPKLEIIADKNMKINLTNCEDCKMLIVGPNLSLITSQHYQVFNKSGDYKIFVVKDSEVILNKTFLWKLNKSKNLIENKKLNKVGDKNLYNSGTVMNSSILSTGKFYEKNFLGETISNVLNFFIYLFNNLTKVMENSIKK